jgi:uncharacterized protein (DUF2062 family)
MFSFIRKSIRRIFRYIIRSFKNKENRNPAYLGRSFAVGFFSSMWVLWGQSGIALAIWFLFGRHGRLRFNVIVACLTTLITNPLTTPFWFYIYYLTGQFMMDKSAIRFSKFAAELEHILEKLDMESIAASIKLLVKGVGRPILIGSGPWYIIMGIVGYWLGTRIAIHLRRRQHARKKRRIRRMLAYLRHKAGAIIHHGKGDADEKNQVQKNP